MADEDHRDLPRPTVAQRTRLEYDPRDHQTSEPLVEGGPTSMAAPWSEAIDRMLARIQDTAAQVKDGFPHWADPETGRWQTTPDGDWTGGYWIGMLWLAGAATGDPRYRTWAAPLAERLRARVRAETVFKSFPL
jgi:hypothetical protein